MVEMPVNEFKRRLSEPGVQYGMWISLADPGKPAGVLSVNPTLAREYRDAGANFVAVGVDTSMLAKHTQALAESFKEN